MSQNDLSIANQGFPAFRSDLNSALQALGSTNSGTSAPSTTYANQLWYDTTNNILYIRNEDNDAWIKLFTLDQTNDNVESLHGDTIAEATSGSGVTIDSVLLKDGELGSTSSAVPINSSSLNGGQFGGRRNLIINGDMKVAQRLTSKTGITTSNFYTVDRFEFYNVSAGTYTMAQSTTVPTGQGFSNSVKLDCTTADASLSGTDQVRLSTYLEGQDLQQLKYGTSDAESLTLQFWVKSNKTGTYIVWFIQPDDDRQNSASYTINSANTWEKKTITLSGDTTGVIDNDNGRGLEISFILASGSDYTSGTAPSDWEARVNANRYAGQTVNLSDNTANEWLMTGFQMEVGSVATPFEHRSYGEELSLCQRYFEVHGTGSDNPGGWNFKSMPVKIGHVGDYVQGTKFAVEKRADPTVVIYSRNGTSGKVSAFSTGADQSNNWSTNAQGRTGFHAVFRDGGSHTVGTGFEYGYTADAEL